MNGDERDRKRPNHLTYNVLMSFQVALQLLGIAVPCTAINISPSRGIHSFAYVDTIYGSDVMQRAETQFGRERAASSCGHARFVHTHFRSFGNLRREASYVGR